MCILVLPVRAMLLLFEDPKALPDPVTRRVEVMRDEGEDDVEAPAPMLGRIFMELPATPLLISLGRLVETMG